MNCHTRTDYQDGVPRRFYRCRSFTHHTGECGARVDAERVDHEVIRWLDYLIADFDTWRVQVLEAATTERDEAQRELDRALIEIDRLDGRATHMEADYLRAIDQGRQVAADRFLELTENNVRDRTRAMQAVAERRAALDTLDAQAVDSRMTETVRRLSDRDVASINEALRVEFESFVVDPDTGDITPEWKPPETEFDLGAALERYRDQQADQKYTEPC